MNDMGNDSKLMYEASSEGLQMAGPETVEYFPFGGARDKRIAELEAALLPFARAGEILPASIPDNQLIRAIGERGEQAMLRAGDFRAAAKTLEES